jgi:hypothetical protein
MASGLAQVVAPLRPTWKSGYPQVSMAEYATWVRDDGLSIDPWIRTHQRMGARILRPAPDSMVIPGTVAQWETWAGMPFPATGEYVVPDALNLVHVDREHDRAVYREENLLDIASARQPRSVRWQRGRALTPRSCRWQDLSTMCGPGP